MLHKLAMNSSPGTSHDFPGTSASRDTLPFTCSTLYVLTRCWPALPMVPCSSLSFLDGVPGPLFCFSGAWGRLSRGHPRCCSAHCGVPSAVPVLPVKAPAGYGAPRHPLAYSDRGYLRRLGPPSAAGVAASSAVPFPGDGGVWMPGGDRCSGANYRAVSHRVLAPVVVPVWNFCMRAGVGGWCGSHVVCPLVVSVSSPRGGGASCASWPTRRFPSGCGLCFLCHGGVLGIRVRCSVYGA